MYRAPLFEPRTVEFIVQAEMRRQPLLYLRETIVTSRFQAIVSLIDGPLTGLCDSTTFRSCQALAILLQASEHFGNVEQDVEADNVADNVWRLLA
jgi:hypothetical protein